MMRNMGRTVPIDTIVDYVWGDGMDPDSTVARANVSRLRKKLCLGDEDDVIHTVRDIGYVFYHGEISCASDIGKGTTFLVRLPR